MVIVGSKQVTSLSDIVQELGDYVDGGYRIVSAMLIRFNRRVEAVKIEKLLIFLGFLA